MSEALDKAKGALDAAKTLARELEPDAGVKERNIMYLDLLSIASAQANIAQAEALEEIAREMVAQRKALQRPGNGGYM